MPWIVKDVIPNFVDVIYVADGRPMSRCCSLCAEQVANVFGVVGNGMAI